MQSKIDKQVQNSDKNTEIKYPKGDKVFGGLNQGSVIEFSMISETIVHDFGGFSESRIASMAKTFDNKYLFVCDADGCHKELDISSLKPVNSLPVKSAILCAVTFDNKFLITADDGDDCKLTKWSIRSKKELHTWMSNDRWVVS